MAKKGTIGAGMALDGEKEFKSAISDINKDLQLLGSEMKKNTDIFGKNTKSQEALTAQSETLEKRMKTQTDKVDTLRNALENAKQEYGENSNKVKDWQIALNRAEGDLGRTKNELENTTRELKQMGDAADGTRRDMNDLGDGVDKSHSKFKNFASGAGTAMMAGAAIVTAAIGTMVSGGIRLLNSQLDNADEISRNAEVYGLSAEEIQKMMYVSTQLDVELETMTKGQTMLTKAMYAAQQGGKAQKDVFEKLGVEYKNSDGSLRNVSDVQAELFDKLKNTSNETERNAEMIKLFGKSALDLVPLVNAGGTEIRKLGEDAVNSGAVISNQGVADLDKFGDSIEGLKGKMTGIAGTILSEYMPSFQLFLDEGMGTLDDFTEKIKAANGDTEEISRVISEEMSELTAVLVAAAPQIAEAAKEIGAAILKGIFTGWLSEWGLTKADFDSGEWSGKLIMKLGKKAGLLDGAGNISNSTAGFTKTITGIDVKNTSKTTQKPVIVNQVNNFNGFQNRDGARTLEQFNRNLGLTY